MYQYTNAGSILSILLCLNIVFQWKSCGSNKLWHISSWLSHTLNITLGTTYATGPHLIVTLTGHTTSCGQTSKKSWAACWLRSCLRSLLNQNRTGSCSSSAWPCFMCATSRSSDSWRRCMTRWSTLRRDDLLGHFLMASWGGWWSWRMKWWKMSVPSSTTWTMSYTTWSWDPWVFQKRKSHLSAVK